VADHSFVSAEPLRKQMQLRLAIAERLQGVNCIEHVVAIGAGTAVALAHIVYQLGKRQPSGILHVAAIDGVAKRPHLPPGGIFQFDAPQGFEINRGDLLAPAQVRDGLFAIRGGDPIGNAAAHAAAIQSEHEARPLRRAAMNKRIDAQRPVQSIETRRHTFESIETGPPHQRPIAKNP
jgi:hypothetical protein